MRIGDAFPEAERRQHAISSLTAGRVLRLMCDFTTPTKPKMLVVASPDDPLLALVINSEMSSLAKANADIRSCQIILPVKDHGFLEYDSYLACHEAYPMNREKVIRQLTGDPARILDELSANARTAARDAVERADTLPRTIKNRILAVL